VTIVLSEKEVKEAIIAHLGNLADNNTEFLNLLHDMKLTLKPQTDMVGTIVSYTFELND